PRLPFTSSESVKRETPSFCAASVMVSPSGSIQSCSTVPPGCGGFFIGIASLPSMVVGIIDIKHLPLFQAKDDAPVRLNRHSPKALEVTLERMRPVSRQVEVLRHPRNIESRQNAAQLFDMPGIQASRVVVLMQALQALMTERPDHGRM